VVHIAKGGKYSERCDDDRRRESTLPTKVRLSLNHSRVVLSLFCQHEMSHHIFPQLYQPMKPYLPCILPQIFDQISLQLYIFENLYIEFLHHASDKAHLNKFIIKKKYSREHSVLLNQKSEPQIFVIILSLL
jgi:hypothetical protein